MPLLNTKIEGKGNGIKTVVPNMADIARALARPPACALSPYPCLLFYTDLWVKLTSFLVSLFFRPDPTKFFGIELGAQVKLDDKTERYIVSGAHDANRLRELLDTFIEKVRLLSFPCQSKPSG
jgi:translation initiation factor 5